MPAEPIPPDYTWPGFEALPKALQDYHRQFFQAVAQRNPLTLREYRRAFRALYAFMQEQGLGDLKALTTQHLEAFQQWGYRRHHWTPGNMTGLVRTLRRIGHFLKRRGVLGNSPFEWMTVVPPQQAVKQEPAQSLSWFRAVRQYFRWLKARGVSSTSLANYLRFLRRFQRFLKTEGIAHPTQITPKTIERFKAYLAVYLEDGNQPLPPSVQQASAWRAEGFRAWLVREGFVRVELGPQQVSTNSGVGSRPARFRRVVHEFLAFVGMRYHPRTQREYARSLRHFQAWVAARPKGKRIRDMDKLTLEAITGYQRWVNTAATHRDGSLLNQPEKEARLYPLKAFLRFCFRKGFLSEDLRRFVVVPRREHKVPKRLLSAEEMAQLLEAPSERTTIGIRDRAMLEMAYSGLRSAELLTLKVTDIQLEENRVFIRQAKGEKDRVVPMTSATRYWVGRWLQRRPEFCRGTDPETCFLSKHARPLTRRHFAVTLLRHTRRAHLPMAVAPHDLRRITATHLAERGAPLRYIQALLGHTSLKITTRYLRLSDAHIKREYTRSHPSNRRERHRVTVA